MPRIIALFAHTSQGNAALADLLEAGIPHADIAVIGDLGPAVSTPHAEHHVTFDALHLPTAERELFMDTVRTGGVVLAVNWAAADFIEQTAWRHHALKTLQASPATPNPSHNQAP